MSNCATKCTFSITLCENVHFSLKTRTIVCRFIYICNITHCGVEHLDII